MKPDTQSLWTSIQDEVKGSSFKQIDSTFVVDAKTTLKIAKKFVTKKRIEAAFQLQLESLDPKSKDFGVCKYKLQAAAFILLVAENKKSSRKRLKDVFFDKYDQLLNVLKQGLPSSSKDTQVARKNLVAAIAPQSASVAVNLAPFMKGPRDDSSLIIEKDLAKQEKKSEKILGERAINREKQEKILTKFEISVGQSTINDFLVAMFKAKETLSDVGQDSAQKEVQNELFNNLKSYGSLFGLLKDKASSSYFERTPSASFPIQSSEGSVALHKQENFFNSIQPLSMPMPRHGNGYGHGHRSGL